ncbi:MAG: Two-component regulatory system protein containing hybrid kinase and response regulator domain [Rhodocyclaceae bacterium]|nr:Two-component regulatory system protein containing hybrid kinase and response regulator domain [Rhodocyclaceae bacterium]
MTSFSASMLRPRQPTLWPLRLQQGARYAAWLVGIIALVGLVGWVGGLRGLTSFGTDYPPILPSAIACLLAAAVGLEALQGNGGRRQRRRVARGAALVMAVIALLSLLERVGRVSVGMTFTLYHLGYANSAILSAGSSGTYLLLAAALACAAGKDARARNLTRSLAFVIAGIAVLALVGLIFRIVQLSVAVPAMDMAFPAALALLASSFSLVAMRPETRLLQLLEHDSPGATVFRRLLPAALVLPMLVGGAEALGQRHGWIDIAAGEGLATVSMMIVCTALIWWTASKLDDMNIRRSLAESRADTQREWLEVTLAHIGDAVIAANDEGRVGFMNPATEALCGIEPSAAVGRPVSELLELVDERTQAPVECPLQEALARRRPVTAAGEPALRLPDGRLRAVDASAMPILGPGGSLLGGVLVLRDARQHRAREKAMRNAYTELDRRVGERTLALERAAAALRESTALLQTIAASTPELIVAKDRECRIMMINPAALQALGLTREEAMGRREMDIFGKTGETVRCLESDQRVMDTGEPMSVEENRMTAAGTRTFLVTKSPLRDEDGLLLGLVSVATDITERKQAQRELEQLLLAEHRLRGDAERASRAKDEFLAIVSHELRSPLNALKGWSQLLSGTSNPDPILSTRAAQAIKRNVEHQTRLIDDLLDTSRIIIGKLVLERRPVNLVEVVHTALDLSRSSAQAKEISLRFAADGPELMVNGDQGRLQQVVINLLSNGVKFTPPGGRVEIELRQAGERIELAVADNGIGIEEDFLPLVFDRFSQADSSTTRRYSGLGIGLALVRHLVEMHGGTVAVASPGPGLGSVFTVSLPAADPAAGPEVAGEGYAAPDEGLQGIQVLVVDDDPDARDVMQLILARAGAQVRLFASGRDLMAALRERPPMASPAVLLLDIAMPGEDGFAVLAGVRAIKGLPFIPAIAVTALTHLDRGRLAAAGFQGCLGKPVEAAKLVEGIVALVERAFY